MRVSKPEGSWEQPGWGTYRYDNRTLAESGTDKIHRLMHGRAVIRAPGITGEHALTVSLSRARKARGI
jgi:hypothetical protein